MIQTTQQQRFKVKETSLVVTGCVPGVSALRGTTLACPGSVVLTRSGTGSWAVIIPSSMSEKKAANSSFLLPSQAPMPGAGVATVHSRTRVGMPGPLQCQGRKDGRLTHGEGGAKGERGRKERETSVLPSSLQC